MDQVLVPGLTLAISILAALFAQWRSQKAEDRAQKIDDRAAAKETVALLATQNEALTRELGDMRQRLSHFEAVISDCQRERELLLQELLIYRKKGAPDT